MNIEHVVPLGFALRSNDSLFSSPKGDAPKNELVLVTTVPDLYQTSQWSGMACVLYDIAQPLDISSSPWLGSPSSSSSRRRWCCLSFPVSGFADGILFLVQSSDHARRRPTHPVANGHPPRLITGGGGRGRRLLATKDVRHVAFGKLKRTEQLERLENEGAPHGCPNSGIILPFCRRQPVAHASAKV